MMVEEVDPSPKVGLTNADADAEPETSGAITQ
jgi:hypothetical protein